MTSQKQMKQVQSAYQSYLGAKRLLIRHLVEAAGPSDQMALNTVLRELTQPDEIKIHRTLKRRAEAHMETLRTTSDFGDVDFTVIETPED